MNTDTINTGTADPDRTAAAEPGPGTRPVPRRPPLRQSVAGAFIESLQSQPR